MEEQIKFQDSKVLIFKLGQIEYGISISQVVSIERMQAISITSYPNRPPHVLGVTSIRNGVTPIVDIRAALTGEVLQQTDVTRMIIVKVYDKEIGLVVDAATDVLELPPETIDYTNILETKDVSYIIGVSKLESRLVILLDIENLLDDTTNLDELKQMIESFMTNKEKAES